MRDLERLYYFKHLILPEKKKCLPEDERRGWESNLGDWEVLGRQAGSSF